MPDILILEQLLRARGLSLAGPIASSLDGAGAHFVFVKATIEKDGRRTPSSFALNRISDEALRIGYKIAFVVVDGDRSDLDGSLKTMLFGKFSDKVRNSFAAFSKGKADVWIEPKRVLTGEENAEVQSAISDFLSFLSIELKSVDITQAENIPTSTAILRTLRTFSPCTMETLSAELVLRKFTVPNEIWMNHALDRLRKTGQIVRRKNGDYFLSLKGLTALGTQKNRLSPDIVRALALAKKGA